jgi:hypothetical protein
MNMRAATVQSTAVVASKAVLDEIALEKYDITKQQIVEMATDLNKFLDDGKIGDLPVDKAKFAIDAYMTSKGWTQYVPAVNSILDIIAEQTIPVAKLGADNIAVIKMGLDQIVISANTSRKEWRRQQPTTEPTPKKVRLVN